MPAIDEFGGYSSRLRIPDARGTNKLLQEGQKEAPQKKVYRKAANKAAKSAEGEVDEACPGGTTNLCHLLNIDVERMALEIVEADLASKRQASK